MSKRSWKLSDDDKAAIVRAVVNHGVAPTEAAQRFGVTHVTIWRVIKMLAPEHIKKRRPSNKLILTDDVICLGAYMMKTKSSPRMGWRTLAATMDLPIPFLRKVVSVGEQVFLDAVRLKAAMPSAEEYVKKKIADAAR